MPANYLLAGFFTLTFLLVACLAGVFLAVGLALLAFFTTAFLATGFLADDFLAVGFLAGSPFAALAMSNSMASSRVSDSGSMLFGRVARSLPCCTYKTASKDLNLTVFARVIAQRT